MLNIELNSNYENTLNNELNNVKINLATVSRLKKKKKKLQD